MSNKGRSAKYLIGMPASDSIGGPIASEPPFVEALRSKGVDVVTAVYVFGDKLTPTPLLQRITRVLHTAIRFRRLIRRNRPALIFLNSAFDSKTILRDSASLFLMHPGEAKVFVKLHGSMAHQFRETNFVLRSLIRYLQRKVDGWGYFTREELEAFVRLGFDRARFFPVRNAIDAEVGPPTERSQKQPNEVFELLFVSRFIPAKGLIPTILACEELRKRGVRFRLTCVGDGEARRDAEDTVGRLGLGRVVRFTGHLAEDEVTKRMHAADIFVFPTSHPEGFPVALFKAIATGLPVVTTNTRAAADFLSEPENCFYSTTDPEDIADRIEQLIKDKPVRERMSRANIEYGLTLKPDKIADEFLDIFARLLGDTGGESPN